MSQSVLGQQIGLTFQQVQKYERGANRISSSKLWRLAEILDVPVSFFFDDLQVDVTENSTLPDVPVSSQDNLLARRETLELVRAYYRIADPNVRKRIFELTKATGASFAEGADDGGGESE